MQESLIAFSSRLPSFSLLFFFVFFFFFFSSSSFYIALQFTDSGTISNLAFDNRNRTFINPHAHAVQKNLQVAWSSNQVKKCKAPFFISFFFFFFSPLSRFDHILISFD